MPNLRASVLIDARRGPPPPRSTTPLPGVEVLVAGPDQALDIREDAPEAEVFHALVAAAKAPLCLWMRSGDIPVAGRVDRMLQAIVRLGVPVVAHQAPGPRGGIGTGQLARVPLKQVAGGTALHPDTLAFRREVARFAPTVDKHRHGTRRALLAWAAMRGGVGFVDQTLLVRPPSAPPPQSLQAQRRAQATQAALSAVDTFVELGAPQPILDLASQYVLKACERWTWTHWSLLVHRHKPRWSPPEGESL